MNGYQAHDEFFNFVQLVTLVTCALTVTWSLARVMAGHKNALDVLILLPSLTVDCP